MEAVDGFAFQRLGGPAGRNRIAAELFYRITAKLVFPFFSSHLSPTSKKQ